MGGEPARNARSARVEASSRSIARARACVSQVKRRAASSAAWRRDETMVQTPAAMTVPTDASASAVKSRARRGSTPG